MVASPLEGGGGGGPSFAYTIGLSQTLAHPELIMVGRDPYVCHTILNAAAIRIQEGERFVPPPGQDHILVANLFGGGYTAAIKRLTREAKLEYLCQAAYLYGEAAFEALQIVMPDSHHRFPWDEGYDSQAMRGQVALY